MRATALEFRLRMPINLAILVLGLWSPWNGASLSARRIPILEWLPTQIARAGLLDFAQAFLVVIVLAALIAALAVVLRVWGSAYLGPATVISRNMRAAAVTAEGPYRYVRNPLYLGLFFMFAAIAVLMPPSGALVALVLEGIFIVRLTLGEEVFLTAQLGEPYRSYLGSVPRFIPRLRTFMPRTSARPNWPLAAAAEITSISIFVALSCFSFSYSSRLIGQVMLVGFGISLIVRALINSPSRSSASAPPAV
jgi:protein-S-isoprenylcysteine O-methyltransferase Ste14